MKNPEILAPAGSKEQLLASVRRGADAVYLGLKDFNAREKAENFSPSELKNVIEYCHARDVSVYVAMNSLITDDETEKARESIKTIAESGADGVILADLGLFRMWKNHCPDMPCHASTQTTVHNVYGAKFLENEGFKRIVLSRELTLSEIEKIAKSVSCEIEVFVHGALCVSVSGTCLFSSMLGGRSGNRGKCAQPCRLNFKTPGREYALSLKDLSLLDRLRDLKNAGADSFKIEGRLKRPEYAAAAVTAVKKALDNEDYDRESLKNAFSRSGFTSGYLDGRRDESMFGVRTYEDVLSSEGELKKYKALYKGEIKKIPVDFNLISDKNAVTLTASDGKNEALASVKNKESETKALEPEIIKRQLNKTGGTIFYLRNFNCEIKADAFCKTAEINALRRDALNKLYEKRLTATPYEFKKDAKEPSKRLKKENQPEYRLRFRKFKDAFFDGRAEKVILPLDEILENAGEITEYREKIICETPFLLFPFDEDALETKLKTLKNLRINSVSVDNIGTLNIALKMGFNVSCGHGLNVLNSQSVKFLEDLGVLDITVSPETNMELVKNLDAHVKTGLIGYGKLPLMRLRVCPVKNGECGKCPGEGEVEDRYGKSFTLLCEKKKYRSLLNNVPLYIGDKDLSGIDFATLYFTVETKAEAMRIFERFINGESPEGGFTRGLYYKKLL